MGRPGGSLRYADLEIASPAAERPRHTRAQDDVVEARFKAKLAERQSMASDEAGEGRRGAATPRPGRQRGDPGDGTKSLARIEARMAKRADRTALRDALDLIRQQELLENIEARRARTRQRRWYVIGRALDDLMAADTALRDAVMQALDRHLVRRDERQLLGLAMNNNTE